MSRFKVGDYVRYKEGSGVFNGKIQFIDEDNHYHLIYVCDDGTLSRHHKIVLAEELIVEYAKPKHYLVTIYSLETPVAAGMNPQDYTRSEIYQTTKGLQSVVEHYLDKHYVITYLKELD